MLCTARNSAAPHIYTQQLILKSYLIVQVCFMTVRYYWHRPQQWRVTPLSPYLSELAWATSSLVHYWVMRALRSPAFSTGTEKAAFHSSNGGLWLIARKRDSWRKILVWCCHSSSSSTQVSKSLEQEVSHSPGSLRVNSSRPPRSSESPAYPDHMPEVLSGSITPKTSGWRDSAHFMQPDWSEVALVYNINLYKLIIAAGETDKDDAKTV